MRQVIVRIPIRFSESLPDWWQHIDIYGFGLMLFVTFLVTTWMTGRRAEKEGIAKTHIQDLAIWIFFGGIVGARITFMIQYGRPLTEFFNIWQGGLVFYGSAIGGLVGYALAYVFVVRKYGLSSWKMADIIAPSAAVGLAIGRVGCLLNGCCYGNVACCEHCPAIHFPLSSPSRFELVEHGYQTAAGFTIASRRPVIVGALDTDSPAYASGLRSGDEIVEFNGRPVQGYAEVFDYLVAHWPRGETEVALTVRRGDDDVKLPAFKPVTLGLHPTQIYESISMILLFLLLTAYYPFRRHDGEVMVLFMICYPIHRFLNEMLRNDTDFIGGTHMTLSQNGSIFFLVVGLTLAWWLRRQPAQYHQGMPLAA